MIKIKKEFSYEILAIVAIVAIVAVVVLIMNSDSGLTVSASESSNIVGQAINYLIVPKQTMTGEITCGEIIKDVEGNEYNTVEIGTQCWMAENLKTKKYNDGSNINYVITGNDWEYYAVNSIDAYCNVDGNSANFETYGLLYNAFAVTDERGICPIGFRVPFENDWMELVSYLGGNPFSGYGTWSETLGGMLKEEGTSHWNSPNIGATDDVGFTALPAGVRSAQSGSPPYLGQFNSFGEVSWFWSLDNQEWSFKLYHTLEYIFHGLFIPGRGESVRCVCDEYIDCAGVCGGSLVVDECGTCDDDASNDCVQDCAGTWGGSLVVDECGVCDGSGYTDNCGVCDGNTSNDCVQDCAGTWGGSAVVDECGVCDGDPSNDCVQDCVGEWGGSAVVNECGCSLACPEGTVTEINNCIFADESCTGETWCFDDSGTMTPISCSYCEGVVDECGVCDGDNSSCADSIYYNLSSGYNLIGIPLDFKGNNDLDSVFSELLPDNLLSITKGGYSSIYTEDGWMGSISAINEKSGYWVWVDEAQEFYITAFEIINPIYDIHIGSNLVSYPNKEGLPIADALCEYVNGEILAVLGEGISAVYDTNIGWTGSLTVFERGNGYWIQTSQDIEGFHFCE